VVGMQIAPLIRRMKDAALGMPVFIKVMGIAFGMAVFIGGGLFWQIHYPYLALETEEVVEHAGFIGQVVASGVAPYIRNTNQTQLQNYLEDIVRITPGLGCVIASIQILDSKDHVIAEAANASLTDAGQRLLKHTVQLPGDIPGHVSVALKDNHIDYELAWHTERIVGTTTVFGLLGIAATWWLMHLTINPIRELVTVVRAVKAGNYRARASVLAKDEVGELAAAFNETLGALQQKDAINRQLVRKLITAEEEERKRVSRELHDHTGQALASLILRLSALKSDERTEQVNELVVLATQTLSDVHDLSRTLHPGILDDLGLLPAFRKLGASITGNLGIKVDFAAIGMDDEVRLPGALEVALYRIVQEALTNAIHHGQAKSVEVLIHRRANSILAVVEDNGKGFDARDWRLLCLQGDHLGLLGIEERAVQLGGTLRIESRPGAGTSLFVEFPLDV
jgi:signal transduction histidine kinase